MNNTSYLFLANGFEDLEAIATIDILRRGGIDVKTVSIYDKKEVSSAHGITIIADTTFNETDFSNADWLILPGGLPGASNLAKFAPLNNLLVKHNNEKRHIAAICASPSVVLSPLGILDGREAVCYPGFELPNAKMGYIPVVRDGNIITANGPSSAILFAITIVAQARGENIAREIGEGLLLYSSKCKAYYF